MNRKQILRATGAFVLLAAGVFSGRASKFANAAAIYYTDGSHVCRAASTSISGSSVLTTGSAKTQATMLTSGGTTFRNLYSTANCGSTRKLHFNAL